jgi:hypothetical protein
MGILKNNFFLLKKQMENLKQMMLLMVGPLMDILYMEIKIQMELLLGLMI